MYVNCRETYRVCSVKPSGGGGQAFKTLGYKCDRIVAFTKREGRCVDRQRVASSKPTVYHNTLCSAAVK